MAEDSELLTRARRALEQAEIQLLEWERGDNPSHVLPNSRAVREEIHDVRRDLEEVDQ